MELSRAVPDVPVDPEAATIMYQLPDFALEDDPTVVSVPPLPPPPILRHFGYDHLPEHLQVTSKPFHDLAHLMVSQNRDGAELRAGLRKLLEAKDCMVRACLDGRKYFDEGLQP